MAGYYSFDVNSSFMCLAICSSHICKCLGDFWVYLGRNSFSQRISKIYGNRKFGRSDVLKLEFEVNNWKTYNKHKTVTHQAGVLFRGHLTVWWYSKTFFSLQ